MVVFKPPKVSRNILSLFQFVEKVVIKSAYRVTQRHSVGIFAVKLHDEALPLLLVRLLINFRKLIQDLTLGILIYKRR